jgi:hypothetical protein
MFLWLKKIKETKTIFLEKSFGLMLDALSTNDIPHGVGERRKMSLPDSLFGNMSTIWESPGGTRRDGVPPVSADDEAKIVMCIVQELSEKFSLELSLSPALSRTEGEQGQIKTLYVIVGQSHGRRVGEALLNRGEEVINIPIKTGEFSTANSKIEAICLEHKGKNIVFVFVVLDNLAYYGQKDDSSVHSSFSDKKGKFHVEGRLVLATKTLLHQHVKELAKTMLYCGSSQKYLLGPFPRYLLDRCCDNNKHITNLDDDDYISYLIGSCRDTSRAVRELCFTCGVRKVRILNPLVMMVGDVECVDELDREALAMLWGDDPVHPYTSAYDNIAEYLSESVAAEKKPAEQKMEKRPPSKSRPVNRASWINSDTGGVIYAPRGARGSWPRSRGNRRPFRGRGWRGGQRFSPY